MISNLVVISAVLLLLSCQHVAKSSDDKSCEFPKGRCLCYSELESSLFATDQNRISLSTAFFPVEDNPPEFVTVHYYFSDTNEEQVWFWSAVTSHFLHPFEVFQFLSLFFGRPEPYYRGSLKITLQAECANLSSTDVKLQLLTQRLKIYAERGTVNLVLRDDYSAKAYSEDSLKVVFERNSQRTTRIIISTAILVVVLCLVVIALVGFTYACTKSHKKAKLIEKLKKNPSAVQSIAALSLITNIYIICLASSAVHYWRILGEDVLRDLFHKFDEERNLVPLVFALITDVLFLCVWWFVFVVTVLLYNYSKSKQGPCKDECTCESVNRRSICHCKMCSPDQLDKCEHCTNCTICCNDYVPFLSLTVFCPIFCIIAHSPYIAIAYLDDGSHASSIFIYYSLIGYLLFGIMWLFFHWCENFEGYNVINGLRTRTLIFLAVVIVILLGLIVTITCYFVLIPINKSISDAPSRVFSIYQSGGFVIGSFIVYRILRFLYRNKEKDTTERIYTLLQERVPIQQQTPQTAEARTVDGEDNNAHSFWRWLCSCCIRQQNQPVREGDQQQNQPGDLEGAHEAEVHEEGDQQQNPPGDLEGAHEAEVHEEGDQQQNQPGDLEGAHAAEIHEEGDQQQNQPTEEAPAMDVHEESS